MHPEIRQVRGECRQESSKDRLEPLLEAEQTSLRPAPEPLRPGKGWFPSPEQTEHPRVTGLLLRPPLAIGVRGRRHLLHLQLVIEDQRLQPTGHPQALRAIPAAVLQAPQVIPAAALQAIQVIPAVARPAIRVTPAAARPALRATLAVVHPAIRVTPVAVRHHPPATPGGVLHPGTQEEHPGEVAIAEAPEDNKHLQHNKI